MKKLALVGLVIFTQLLVSCQRHVEPKTEAVRMPWYRWVCDSGAVVEWSYEDASKQRLQFRLDNSRQLSLFDKIHETELGVLYSDGTTGLRIKDNQGLVFWTSNDDIIGSNCTGSTFIPER